MGLNTGDSMLDMLFPWSSLLEIPSDSQGDLQSFHTTKESEAAQTANESSEPTSA